ncbi:peamaclein-like [Typha angustifolia]|uniref:peamaclein-like n=1 Tax=Typha angustifolia TaxID=59011 RepID=UPI003C2DB06C
MAFCKCFVALLFLFMLAVQLVDSSTVDNDHLVMMSHGRSLLEAPKINCGASCGVRCSKNWKNKMCKKLCGICCSKCNCVPPGTGQDTRHMCPCYDKMTNRVGRPKCP